MKGYCAGVQVDLIRPRSTIKKGSVEGRRGAGRIGQETVNDVINSERATRFDLTSGKHTNRFPSI